MKADKTFWPLFCLTFIISLALSFSSIELLVKSIPLKITGSTILGFGIGSIAHLVQLLQTNESHYDVYKWIFSGIIGAMTGLICASTTALGLKVGENKQDEMALIGILVGFEALGGALSFVSTKAVSNKVNKKPNFW